MKTYLAALLVLTYAGTAYAQDNAFAVAMRLAGQDITAGQYVQANTDLVQALALAQTDVERSNVFLQLALVASEEQNYARARVQLSQIIDLRNADPAAKDGARLSIAASYEAEHRYEECRDELWRLLRSDGFTRSFKYVVQVRIAQDYVHEGKYDEARQEFAKLVDYKDIFPAASTTVHLFFAQTYHLERDYEDERTECAEAILIAVSAADAKTRKAMRPDLQAAQLRIADSYALEGDYDRAKQEYEKLLRMDSVDPDFAAQGKAFIAKIDEIQAAPAKP